MEKRRLKYRTEKDYNVVLGLELEKSVWVYRLKFIYFIPSKIGVKDIVG